MMIIFGGRMAGFHGKLPACNFLGGAVLVALLAGCSSDNDSDSSPDIENPVTVNYQVSLAITPEGAGTVEFSPQADEYADGAEVTLTAAALEGYEFVNWSGDIGAASAEALQLSLTMDSDKSVTAVFAAIQQGSDIVINEVRSDEGGFDYIELYNRTDVDYIFAAGEWAVNDLKGLEEDMEPGINIPAGTVIPANGFLLIATDQTAKPFGAPESTLVAVEGDTDFGLGKGDTALLVRNGEIVDSANWESGTHVNTWGRLPDGGDWHAQAEALEATPGTANALPAVVVPASADDIVINEVVSKGRDDADFDFVELYNRSSEPYVFAEGEWELRDGDLAEVESGLVIPAGTEIPGQGFLVLLPGVISGSALPAGAPADAVQNGSGDFGLGKGETITLYHLGAEHESLSYGDFHVNAYGRLPDGGDFIALSENPAEQLYASPGLKNFMTPAMVLTAKILNFSGFTAQEANLESLGLRVFGLNAEFAADLEPEYVAVSADATTAWVSLQENNGIARLDLVGETITDIFPLGFKDHGVEGNEIDGSDKDDAVNFQTYANVLGIYQPDGIATFNDGGVDYVISANEGDVRDWFSGVDFEEGLRVEDVALDESVFTSAAELQAEGQLGRLTVTQYLNSDSAAQIHSTLYSFGARSFTIWDGTTGTQVFDSGSDLARQAATAGVYPDDRSDAKGTEPESVTVGMVGSKRFAFIALERADAVAVYDITIPSAPVFSQMLVTEGDDAPEGVLFVSAADAPTGAPLLVVSNEDSGNVTVYQADTEGEFTFTSRLLLEGGTAAAEISAYDPTTKKLFVVNNGELLSGSRIEVLDLADPANIALLGNIDVSYYGGGINSVSVAGGKLAGAIEAVDKAQAGHVVIFDTSSHKLLGIATVGALPDMVTFTPDGQAILTADEGEPSEDYSVDPLGSVSIIRLPVE